MWQFLGRHTDCLSNTRFGGIRSELALGNIFGRRLSNKLVHDCMNSPFVDSFVFAETATEVESTSAISSEVRPTTLSESRKSF